MWRYLQEEINYKSIFEEGDKTPSIIEQECEKILKIKIKKL